MLTLSACGGELELEAPLGPGGPEWSVTPDALGLQPALGTPGLRAVLVEAGASDRTITNVTVDGDLGFTLQAPPLPFVVPAGGRRAVQVGFQSDALEPRSATLVIEADDGTVREVALTGAAQSPCHLLVGQIFEVPDPSRHPARVMQARVDNIGPRDCPLAVVAAVDGPALGDVTLRSKADPLIPPGEPHAVRFEVEQRCPGRFGFVLELVGPGLSLTRSAELDDPWTDPLVLPSRVDFGEVPMGCTTPRTIHLYGMYGDLTLESAEVSAPVHVDARLPAGAPRGFPLDLPISAAPSALGPARRTLSLQGYEMLDASCPERLRRFDIDVPVEMRGVAVGDCP